MVEINLLPWRSYRSNYQLKMIKQFAFLSVLFLGIIGSVSHLLLTHSRDQISAKIDLLKMAKADLSAETELALPAEETTEKTAVTAVSAIKLSGLFASFSNVDTASICFLSLAKQKHAMVFTGEANSMADLTLLMKKWELAPYFSQINIEQLQQKEEHRIRFRLRAIENK